MASRAQAITAYYRAWDTVNGTWKTGDAANHTIAWVKDGTAATASGTPTEVANGLYKAALNSTECTCDSGCIEGSSSTTGIIIAGLAYTFEQLPTVAAGANAGLPVVGTQIPNATAGVYNGLALQGPISLHSGTCQNGASTTSGITTVILDSGAAGANTSYIGSTFFVYFGNGAPYALQIASYNGTTKAATLVGPWIPVTLPDSTSLFSILPTQSMVAAGNVANTTQLAGQTVTAGAGVAFPASVGTSTLTQAQVTGGSYPLATTAAGNVGIDWGNIANKTTTVNLTATTIASAGSSGVATGTAQAGGATTITLQNSGSATVDNTYKGGVVSITGGTGFGQTRAITAYVGSTKVATVDVAWVTNPDSSSQYQVTPAGNVTIQTGTAAGQLDITSGVTKANTTQLAGQTVTAAAGVTFAATVGTSTLTQAQVTGGAYALATDGSGNIKISPGTGTGQLLITSGVVSANAVQIAGQTTSASAGITFPSSVAANNEIRANTAQAGGSTTITLDAGASATNSFYVGETVELVSGTGAGQTKQITAYVGATKVATVATAWAVNPDNTTGFKILASGSGGSVNVGTITAGAITSAAFAAGAVTAASLFNVDGLAIDHSLQAMQSVLFGTTTVSGSTVTFKRQDGTTASVAVTTGSTPGERTASTVS